MWHPTLNSSQLGRHLRHHHEGGFSAHCAEPLLKATGPTKPSKVLLPLSFRCG